MNLKQLSEALGLSQTTVSRALNGYPEVSEKTREKVRKAALAANYQPSKRARSLATGRAMAIGHVIPVSTQQELVNPVFGDFIAGAGEIYSAEGYDMILSLVKDSDEADFYRDLKIKGNVDGIIVHGPRMADPRIALLKELGLPFVVHGRASDIDLPYDFIDVPNITAFDQATTHMIELGHRRIALINGVEDLDFACRRRKGYERALSRAGLRIDPALMHSSDMTEAYGYNAARDMLDTDNPPTGFAVASMITALGVRRAIEERGLKTGRDVSIVTFDDDLSYMRNGTQEAPIFTAVQSSVRDAGRHAARMLLDRVANPNAPAAETMMDCGLIIGETTGPVPKN
ncbi:substrate-binding domain-containing protein [Primorskyibacter aestuariivivens]|uniref:LacI family DNA-binding transcriptional regulator n=1 Tax=Primorskyibacter aestuariivivens TaxID=1888912 RepID=UPI0023007B3B|nr:substrate-binding domain-containing protein [Primorskyibacter aestuariivivens]MDA7430108.1 substrate-binding domain-containing protein [Primorskyibacter aestuariivivens]